MLQSLVPTLKRVLCSVKMSSQYQKDLELYATEERVYKPAKKVKKFEPKPDPVLLKLHPDVHPLSSEEQMFFLRITEGVFGFNEQVRNDTLQFLAQDYHVKYLAPYLSVFIRDSVHFNIAFPDLSLLIYSIRMVKSVMSNKHVDLMPELHIILPTALSCVLAKKICKYHYDNHWTLRDFAAQIVATICHTYSNKINDIKRRTIRLYLKVIQDRKKPLTTLYGAIRGLASLGDESIRVCLLPLLPFLSVRAREALEKPVYINEGNLEAIDMKKITDLILNVTSPVLLKFRNCDDGGVSYVRDFGYLGYSLYSHMKTLEKAEADRKKMYSVYLLCN